MNIVVMTLCCTVASRPTGMYQQHTVLKVQYVHVFCCALV
jgi:hypothetical protein